jgi:hypothetical protein
MIDKNIEDSYPLSHMQKGMLFHTLRSEGSGVDIEQMVLVLREELSVSAFREAWEQIIQRHPVLRTSFRWDGLDEPLQDVHRKIRIAWQERNLQEISSAEQTAQRDCYLRKDRQRGFDLSQAPLWRFTLSRLAVAEYQFIWSFHHALLDGRSFLLLIKEVFSFYNAIRKGENLELAKPSPFRRYIDWLQQQDIGRGEAFWRKLLSGFSAPTPFTVDRACIATSESPEAEHAEQTAHLSARLTSRLQTFAEEEAVTLNTLVQGAWALLLSRYSGEDDVVFGATRACRRSVVGAETMVGLLINTLPMRLRERAARRSFQEERGKPLLPIAHLLAIALEHVAKRQPAFTGDLHQQEVRYQDGFHRTTAATQSARGVGADDAPERLLVALLGDDRSEAALEGFYVSARTIEELAEAGWWLVVSGWWWFLLRGW